MQGAGGNVLDEAPRRAVSVPSRLGSLARRLDFPGAARFETHDNDGVDRLLGGGSGLPEVTLTAEEKKVLKQMAKRTMSDPNADPRTGADLGSAKKAKSKK